VTRASGGVGVGQGEVSWAWQPTQPVEVRVGEIAVSRDLVHLPSGSYPLPGTAWAVSDQLTEATQIPPYAIVLAVIFVAACGLGLLFLLVKEHTVGGVVEVSVAGDGFHHAVQVPVASYAEVRAVHGWVAGIRRLAAAGAPLET
jgi:hypothetical protein